VEVVKAALPIQHNIVLIFQSRDHKVVVVLAVVLQERVLQKQVQLIPEVAVVVAEAQAEQAAEVSS
jgi:hypothetical protein